MEQIESSLVRDDCCSCGYCVVDVVEYGEESMMLGMRGLADWSSPDCVPGSYGCVPHWYCYIPGAATPDCLASLVAGAKEIGGDIGNAAGGIVNSTVTGAIGGALGQDTFAPPGSLLSSVTPLLFIGAAVVGLVVLLPALTSSRGRRR